MTKSIYTRDQQCHLTTPHPYHWWQTATSEDRVYSAGTFTLVQHHFCPGVESKKPELNVQTPEKPPTKKCPMVAEHSEHKWYADIDGRNSYVEFVCEGYRL